MFKFVLFNFIHFHEIQNASVFCNYDAEDERVSVLLHLQHSTFKNHFLLNLELI